MQQVIKKQQVQILPLPTLDISYSLHLPRRQQFICPAAYQDGKKVQIYTKRQFSLLR